MGVYKTRYISGLVGEMLRRWGGAVAVPGGDGNGGGVGDDMGMGGPRVPASGAGGE